MPKKVNKTDEQLANVEGNLSKAGLYVVANSEKLIKLVGAIILGFTIFFGYNTFFVEPNEKNASSEMYIAEFYFQNNNYDKALIGDGKFSGFLSIADQYSSTEAGNIANYYAAICQMNLGVDSNNSQYFEEALISLNNFETDDKIISSIATGLKGDFSRAILRAESTSCEKLLFSLKKRVCAYSANIPFGISSENFSIKLFNNWLESRNSLMSLNLFDKK